jgi:hypothetical protein
MLACLSTTGMPAGGFLLHGLGIGTILDVPQVNGNPEKVILVVFQV